MATHRHSELNTPKRLESWEKRVRVRSLNCYVRRMLLLLRVRRDNLDSLIHESDWELLQEVRNYNCQFSSTLTRGP